MQRAGRHLLWILVLAVLAVLLAQAAPIRWLALLVAGSLALLGAFLGRDIRALLVWVSLTAIAYPFLRYPAARAIVTFDRVWVVGLACLLLTHRPRGGGSRSSWFLEGCLLWLVIAYGLRAFLTPATASSPMATWVDAMGVPAVVFLVARRVASTSERCDRIAAATVFAGGALAVMGLAQRFLHIDFASRVGSAAFFDPVAGAIRISGPYRSPTPYLVTLLLCLSVTIYWALARRGAARLLALTAAALQLVALALTLHRVAWLAAVVVVVVTLGWRPRHFTRAVTVTAIAGSLVFFALLQAGNSGTLSERVRDTENIKGRVEIYNVGFQHFRSAPLAGVGVDRFVTAQSSLPGTLVSAYGRIKAPHNSYLSALAELGLLGFVPLVAVTVTGWNVVRLYRKRSELSRDHLLAAALTAATMAYFFVSLSLSILPYGPSNAFLALLLGVAAARLDAIDSTRPASSAVPSPASVPEPRLSALSGASP